MYLAKCNACEESYSSSNPLGVKQKVDFQAIVTAEKYGVGGECGKWCPKMTTF